uniref:MADF domain-containing protein n=1 Tax=Knipowitschia caucasica TaxID=637954 RepID=A0AAV2JPK2_KNICA
MTSWIFNCICVFTSTCESDQALNHALLSDDSYRDRNKKKLAWRRVSEVVGVSVEVCKKRWKNLRDTYEVLKILPPPHKGSGERERTVIAKQRRKKRKRRRGQHTAHLQPITIQQSDQAIHATPP